MKKYIAIFSVFTLAFAATAALAGNRAALNNWDDSILTQSNSSSNLFRVNVQNYAKIDSNITMTSNTGGSTLVAGDDLKAGSIESGNADLNYSEVSDVNDSDVQYAGCGCGETANNDTDGTDVNDTIVTQTDTSEDSQAVDANSALDEQFNADFVANTGGSTGAAGGDLGENSPVTINSGDSNATVSRNYVRNFLSFIRN